MDSEQSLEQLSLESLSDQYVEESYMRVTHLVVTKEYKLNDLISCVNPETVDMMGNLLDNTLGKLVNNDMNEKTLNSVCRTLNKNISKWKASFKEILGVVLIKKILNNKDYLYKNKNITEELLKTNFDRGYIEDLAFIWLNGLKSEKDKTAL
jgi:hypothetical protein